MISVKPVIPMLVNALHVKILMLKEIPVNVKKNTFIIPLQINANNVILCAKRVLIKTYALYAQILTEQELIVIVNKGSF